MKFKTKKKKNLGYGRFYQTPIAKRCFPNATQVVDRFHVQNLHRSSSKLRIQYRWEAIDLENEIIKQTKDKKEKSNIPIFEKHDTQKTAIARSQYLL